MRHFPKLKISTNDIKQLKNLRQKPFKHLFPVPHSQDVVMLNKKLTKQRESSAPSNRRSAALPKGLKVMSKESHDRMEAYQHLFYLLQTNPMYLAKLIFEMPQDRTTKFMESVIFSVFNYGSNIREEYLLAKLFKTALEEEIRQVTCLLQTIFFTNYRSCLCPSLSLSLFLSYLFVCLLID